MSYAGFPDGEFFEKAVLTSARAKRVKNFLSQNWQSGSLPDISSRLQSSVDSANRNIQPKPVLASADCKTRQQNLLSKSCSRAQSDAAIRRSTRLDKWWEEILSEIRCYSHTDAATARNYHLYKPAIIN
jgi:hypothetical protein